MDTQKCKKNLIKHIINYLNFRLNFRVENCDENRKKLQLIHKNKPRFA